MKTLTQAQANSLRLLRPIVRPIEEKIAILIGELAVACECEDVQNCPTCLLFSKAHEIKVAADEFGKELDFQLLRGPNPKATTRKEPDR